ncbi:MAG TPA: RNA polymerase sigma factor [Rhizomicrobium sp.]|nr:RNA polymerase sigma factor [Rhizomicrobium sp.]
MGDTSDTQRNTGQPLMAGNAITMADVEAWFVAEVLPLESALMQFLQHNWRNEADIADLRQDVYERVCEAAHESIPDHTKAFLFKTARNLLVDRVRRSQVVPIDVTSDFDALGLAFDAPGPENTTIARDELRRLQGALDRLPPRSRQAVVLGRIEGLSGKEIAARMGVTESTVSIHLANGIRALVNAVYGVPEKSAKKP